MLVLKLMLWCCEGVKNDVANVSYGTISNFSKPVRIDYELLQSLIALKRTPTTYLASL